MKKTILKNIQQQLDLLKNQPIKKAPKGTIQTKSSSLGYLYIISWLIFLSNKLPFINKLTKLLKIYYGRTTFWSILIIARKAFIIFNAIIGLYGVAKISGFGTDSFLAGFTMMGHTYGEMFISTVKRIFNFFYNLFDTKVIPDVPSKPSFGPWSGPGWYSKPTTDNGIMDIASQYKEWNTTFSQKPTPWYKDWYTIGYYALGVFGVVTICCATYLAYSYFTAVHHPVYLPNPGPNSDLGSQPPAIPSGGDPIPATIPQVQVESPTNSSISTLLGTIKTRINPLNWFTNSIDNARNFSYMQSNMNTADTRYYPYTPNNPTDSYFTKLRIHYLGETTLEETLRKLQLENLRNQLPTVDTAGVLREINRHGATFSPMRRFGHSPGNVGLGLHLDPNNFNSWADGTLSRLNSLPNTPTHHPVPLIDTNNLEFFPNFNEVESPILPFSDVSSPFSGPASPFKPLKLPLSSNVASSSTIIPTATEFLSTPTPAPNPMPNIPMPKSNLLASSVIHKINDLSPLPWKPISPIIPTYAEVLQFGQSNTHNSVQYIKEKIE